MCKGTKILWNIQALKKNNSTFQYYICIIEKKIVPLQAIYKLELVRHV